MLLVDTVKLLKHDGSLPHVCIFSNVVNSYLLCHYNVIRGVAIVAVTIPFSQLIIYIQEHVLRSL